MISYLNYYIPTERISVETAFSSLKAEMDLPAPFTTCEDGIAFFKVSWAWKKSLMHLTQCFSSLGFKFEQIFTEILSAFGHLDCIDLIVNLKSLLNHNLKPATRAISFGTGWAGSNIALLLEINC